MLKHLVSAKIEVIIIYYNYEDIEMSSKNSASAKEIKAEFRTEHRRVLSFNDKFITTDRDMIVGKFQGAIGYNPYIGNDSDVGDAVFIHRMLDLMATEHMAGMDHGSDKFDKAKARVDNLEDMRSTCEKCIEVDVAVEHNTEHLSVIEAEISSIGDSVERLVMDRLTQAAIVENGAHNDAVFFALERSNKTMTTMKDLACDVVDKVCAFGGEVIKVSLMHGFGDPLVKDGLMVRQCTDKDDPDYCYSTDDYENCARISCPSIYVFVKNQADKEISVIRIADHDIADEKEFLHRGFEHWDEKYVGCSNYNIVVDGQGKCPDFSVKNVVTQMFTVSKEADAESDMAVG